MHSHLLTLFSLCAVLFSSSYSMQLPLDNPFSLAEAIRQGNVCYATTLLQKGVELPEVNAKTHRVINNFWSTWTAPEIKAIEKCRGFQGLLPGIDTICSTTNSEQAKLVIDYSKMALNLILTPFVGSRSYFDDNSMADVIQYAIRKGAVLTETLYEGQSFLWRLLKHHPKFTNAVNALLCSRNVMDLGVAAEFDSTAAKIITSHIDLFKNRFDMDALRDILLKGAFNTRDMEFLEWLLGYGEFSGTSPEVLALCKEWISRHGNMVVLHHEATDLGLLKIAKVISDESRLPYLDGEFQIQTTNGQLIGGYQNGAGQWQISLSNTPLYDLAVSKSCIWTYSRGELHLAGSGKKLVGVRDTKRGEPTLILVDVNTNCTVRHESIWTISCTPQIICTLGTRFTVPYKDREATLVIDSDRGPNGNVKLWPQNGVPWQSFQIVRV